jgi:hypothetical protein
MAENNIITAVIADLFCRLEKSRFLQVLENWSREALMQTPVDKAILQRMFALYPAGLPKVQIVTDANMETLIRESSEFRKKVRGEAVGRLG